MCGIVGYIGKQNAADVLLSGLRRLEYRGYDSAGVAVLGGPHIQLRRSVGKLSVLEGLLRMKPVQGNVGIGHTRWATHGRPSEENAHPHTCCHEQIGVVHNGIIENYAELKRQLEEKGHQFKSQTDTEVLAHLIEDKFNGDLRAAVRQALECAHGSYALGALSTEDPDRFIAARKDSPLVLGLGKGEVFVASDVPALLPYTRNVIYLEDGDMADIRQDSFTLYNASGDVVTRESQTITWDAGKAEKAGYPHFMLKEIAEQKDTIRQTFQRYLSPDHERVLADTILPAALARALPRICLIGCGTSYHAALVARHWIEEWAHLPCDVEMASEHRYHAFPKDAKTLILAVTQSGETADTLAALRLNQARQHPTLALCNVEGSSVTRIADATLYTQCGPEIGVASTKAFTGQLTAFYVLALYLAQVRETLSPLTVRQKIQDLLRLPLAVQRLEDNTSPIQQAAGLIHGATNALYLGRHVNYPIALEGALKLKEITYIHAEGYPAGEMKHGPIALIERGTPVVALMTESSVREKMVSNMQEVKARGGRLIAVATEGDQDVEKLADITIVVPRLREALTPIMNVIPLQRLAYEVAVLRGCDVDQPRNLAKSVTVE